MFEQEEELGEFLYSKAIEKMKGAQDNLLLLDDIKHIRRVVRPFLIQWGMMRRSVGRKTVKWSVLGDKLRNLDSEFGRLRNQKLSTCDFENAEVKQSITKIYNEIDPIPYIGTATSISKILHILNPNLFVMWDNEIKNTYHKQHVQIRGDGQGYLEFLRQMKEEVAQILEDGERNLSCNREKLEDDLCSRFRKPLAKLIDEYNWWICHKKPASLDLIT